MRQLVQFLLIASIALSVQGCALALTRVKFSQPTVSGGSAKMSDNGFLDLGELVVGVAPLNQHYGPTFAGPIPALFIPLPSPVPTYSQEYFAIQIFLDPKNKELPTGIIGVRDLCPECRIDESVFSLDPTRITLRTDDGKSYSPVAYRTSARISMAKVRIPQRTRPLLAPMFNMDPIISQWDLYHYCDAPKSGDLYFEELKGAVEFSDQVCFVLKFNVPPPPPDRSFALSIGDGIKKAGVDIPVPLIRFEMGTGWMRSYR